MNAKRSVGFVFNLWLALVAALAWLAGGAAGPRVSAAIFPAQGDDSMNSMGVFKLVVAPAFRPLMAPNPPLISQYPGYFNDGRLVSPLLIDNATKVGRSAPHDRPLAGSLPIGSPSMGNAGYSDYSYIPPIFAGAPAGTREILTRIRSFALESIGQRGGCTNNDPRLPQIPLMHRMVYAGPGQGVARPSLGMVQEKIPNGAADPDFPAQSFFDIFVEVSLPPVPGTTSQGIFPLTGAILYNDSPLVITNLNLTSLPPQVVYIHGETPAVPLKFRDNNAPHWSAGDVFGYLVLAGHGTQIDCNDTAATTAFIDAVLGPIGQPKGEMPIEWPLPGDLCPWPGVTYDSVQDVDVVRFNTPLGLLLGRNFVHGNLQPPINPPPLGQTADFNGPQTTLRFEVSLDGGVTWEPGNGIGPTQVRMSHTTDQGMTRFFDTEILAMDLSGLLQGTPFMLRESPTRQSRGKHTIRKSPQGFMVSSFFDVFLELSITGVPGTFPGDKSVRVQLSSTPCGAAEARVNMERDGNILKISWSDPSYQLECRNSLDPSAPWVVVPGPSPVMQTLSPTGNRYYRLNCP